MSDQTNYGSKYWCISTYDDDPVYICADYIEVSVSGSLLAWGGFRGPQEESPKQMTVLYAWAPQTWDKFFAASGLQGGPVCAY